SLKYFHSFWPSDNTDPRSRVFMQWGYSHFFPAPTIAAHITKMGDRPANFTFDVAMSAALGLDLDGDEPVPAHGTNRHVAVRDGVLECVLEKVEERRREKLWVSVDHDIHRRRGSEAQAHLPLRGLQRCRAFDVVQEPRDGHPLRLVRPRRQADLGDGGVQEVAHAHEAAFRDRPGAPAGRDPPALHRRKRQHGRGEKVTQLVRQVAEPFRFPVPERQLALAAELGHRSSDRIVEAEVQRLEVLGADGNLLIDRRLGDGLADVAVVMDDLRYGKPLRKQLAAVLACTGADGSGRKRFRGGLEAQSFCELGQEQGQPVLQLLRGDGGPLPRRDLRAGARQNLILVGEDELVEHCCSSRQGALASAGS
ncbi:MAG: hypothetical protein EHM13_07860, partial [Acidobacteria bacterium]